MICVETLCVCVWERVRERERERERGGDIVILTTRCYWTIRSSYDQLFICGCVNYFWLIKQWNQHLPRNLFILYTHTFEWTEVYIYQQLKSVNHVLASSNTWMVLLSFLMAVGFIHIKKNPYNHHILTCSLR